MSTINLAEFLILLKSRLPGEYLPIRNEVFHSSIKFSAPTEKEAENAAAARLQYPLNLGDCFAYALAKETGDALLTLDPGFKKTDVQVVLPS